MDLRQTTITRPDEWEQSPFIPLLARTTILPHTIGTNSPTNNTGELYGYLMADDLLPTTWPAIILTDSQVAQTATLLLRDHADTITHRQAIRTELLAISLHLMARLNTVIQRLEDTDWSWHTEQADLVQAFHANTTQWIMAYSSLALDLCHTATATPRKSARSSEDGIIEGTSMNVLEHGRGRPVQQGASHHSITASTEDVSSEGKTSRHTCRYR
mmetsp:Transcript_19936/g.43497  ORF Transcript_19936/g.43497 Transcript_19936/m.43497 type:complete len:215 (-) Transcript_19936:466-1110(-)